ncbi:acyl-CoA dehydrogenase family protein [Mycobacterium sp. C31M]
MTSSDTDIRPPALNSPELRDAITEIAADARARRDEGGGRPQRALELVRQYRLGAVRIPRSAGGGGYTKRDFYSLIIRLAEADPDVPHILRVHWGFAEDRWARHGRDDREHGWVAQIVAGKLFGAAGTELGSKDVGTYNFDTTLTPEDSGYRLNGTKFYSTGSLYSDYVRVSAVNEDGESVTAIVPADREGVVHVDDWDGIGQAETGSGTTLLENVRVEESEILPRRWARGDGSPGGSQPQLILHAIAAGILRAVTGDAAELVRSRPRTYSWATATVPREDPQLQQIVGELSSAAYAVEAIVLAAADAQDRSAAHYYEHGRSDDDLEHESSLAAARTKVAVEGLALRAAGELYGVGGASATRVSTHLDRHWRNLRTLFSHNPTVYKARAVGDYVVNGTRLPEVGFF